MGMMFEYDSTDNCVTLNNSGHYLIYCRIPTQEYSSVVGIDIYTQNGSLECNFYHGTSFTPLRTSSLQTVRYLEAGSKIYFGLYLDKAGSVKILDYFNSNGGRRSGSFIIQYLGE